MLKHWGYVFPALTHRYNISHYVFGTYIQIVTCLVCSHAPKNDNACVHNDTGSPLPGVIMWAITIKHRPKKYLIIPYIVMMFSWSLKIISCEIPSILVLFIISYDENYSVNMKPIICINTLILTHCTLMTQCCVNRTHLCITSSISTTHDLTDSDSFVRVSPLQWRHNEHDGISNHQPHDCLRNRLFSRRSQKTSKFRVTGLCAGNSSVIGEFPAQRASNADNVSIWWRHHAHNDSPLVQVVATCTCRCNNHYQNAPVTYVCGHILVQVGLI